MKTVIRYDWDGLLGCKLMGELGDRTPAALHRRASGTGVRNVTLAWPIAKGVRFRRRAKNAGKPSAD